MTHSAVKPIPDGTRSLTPHLVCAGAADAIQFYVKAFNAVEVVRLPGPGDKLMHACIRIGDSALMLADESPEWGSLGPKALKGSPVTIHLCVEDVDAVVAQAVASGAKVTMPLADMFWGDRYAQLEDPFGHRWSVATHTRDVSPEECSRRWPRWAANSRAKDVTPALPFARTESRLYSLSAGVYCTTSESMMPLVSAYSRLIKARYSGASR